MRGKPMDLFGSLTRMRIKVAQKRKETVFREDESLLTKQ